MLIKEERPLELFFSVFLLLELTAVILARPLLTEYLETGLVPRIPAAVLFTDLALLGFLSLACSLILDTVTLRRCEIKRLNYLAPPCLPLPQDPHMPESTRPRRLPVFRDSPALPSRSPTVTARAPRNLTPPAPGNHQASPRTWSRVRQFPRRSSWKAQVSGRYAAGE